MPASSAEMRARWRKRKRDQLARKSRLKEQENEDAFEDNEDDDDPDLDPPHNNQEGEDDPRNHNMDKIAQPKAEKEGEKVNGGSKICDFPVAIRREVTRHHSSVFQIVDAERAAHYGNSRSNGLPVLENISYGQLQALSVVPRDSPGLIAISSDETSGTGSYVITPPRIISGRGVTKKLGSAGCIHVVPVHSEWFSPNSVHRLERQVVPHIFVGNSNEHTPEKYMECRNFIVAKYMENPEKHLSVADCHGLVDGFDNDDLTRVVRFLDHWGIINYCATSPKEEVMKDGTYMSEDSNGELHVPSAALKSIDSLIKFDKPKCKLKAAEVYPELTHHDEDIDIDNTIREQLSDYICNCCFKSIPTLYYQSQREVDVRLCSDCFHEGKFVVGHSSLDFVKENSIKDYVDMDGDNWSDQETLLLLEGMQLYNENWSKIAEHVGSKSKAQCILHFVRIPIDCNLLNDIDKTSTFGSVNHEMDKRPEQENGFSWVGDDTETSFPFLNSENPVMHLVAFLSSALGPRVAAACAHTSLASLSKDCGKEGSPAGDINSMKKGPWGQDEANGLSLTPEKVRAAAKDGLAAAAMKAKLFADHEAREIQRLSANIVNHQLKRLELKLKQFAEVETLLMRECEQMERTRQRIAAERAAMMSSQFGSPGASRLMSLPGTSNSIANNTIGNNRPQQQQQQQRQILASQQHFTSGYDNNQPNYAHVSMMQQQQQGMYGLGSRLPLSALRPSSNPMFNPALNSQPPLGPSMLRPLSGSKSELG